MAFEPKNFFLNDGVIMENCPQHTKEEWLELMREKSRKQGKAVHISTAFWRFLYLIQY